MSRIALALILATVFLAAPALAQADIGAGAPLAHELVQQGVESLAGPASTDGNGRMATAVEIAVLLTALSLLPAILVTITSFTRIVIVLSFVRRALGVNELPPNPVLIGLALFLTSFVMAPVAGRIYEGAWKPYRAGTMQVDAAGEKAWVEMRGFLLANTRKSELQLFVDMAKLPTPLDEAERRVDRYEDEVVKMATRAR